MGAALWLMATSEKHAALPALRRFDCFKEPELETPTTNRYNAINSASYVRKSDLQVCREGIRQVKMPKEPFTNWSWPF